MSTVEALIARVDRGEMLIGGQSMSPLCTLPAHLALKKSSAALYASGWGTIGVYGVVESALTIKAYVELADYHLKRTHGAGYPEFQKHSLLRRTDGDSGHLSGCAV